MISDQHQHGIEYNNFVQNISDRFNTLTGPIFETDASGLYEAYLAGFPEGAERQYHTCSCCKSFIDHFGGLAYVGADGHVLSAIWELAEAPSQYKDAVGRMQRLVQRAKLTKPFLSTARQYGEFASGERKDGSGLWNHFAVVPAEARIYRGPVTVSAFAAASLKREEFGSVCHALAEYNKETCDMALKLLKDDQLGNSVAALGQAQFMVDLHAIKATSTGANLRSNLIYRAVAAAPSGLCHPRASMIATLLDDIADGKTFEQAQTRWNAKMHPLAYQRPQAAPTAGAIAQAEKMFAAMGLAPALERRVALFEEVPKLWKPKQPVASKPAGVFGHLQPKSSAAAPSMTAPPISITLEKFVRTVVTDAEKIEVQLGNTAHFITITAAVNSDAPKLFQWDHSFAWYVWHGGATPAQYGLQIGWSEVAGITRLPARWGDEAEQKFQHQGDGLVLLVDGARETRSASAGLFPSILRSELREVRSVMESYSNKAKMTGLSEGSAIGIDLRQGGNSFPTMVRVSGAGQSQVYKIDRWD